MAATGLRTSPLSALRSLTSHRLPTPSLRDASLSRLRPSPLHRGTALGGASLGTPGGCLPRGRHPLVLQPVSAARNAVAATASSPLSHPQEGPWKLPRPAAAATGGFSPCPRGQGAPGTPRVGGGRDVTAAAAGASRPLSAAAEAVPAPPPFVWPDGPRRPRVCILGGGFGGLYTALRLDSLIWTPERRPQVLLVDQSDRFVFKPLLYELLTKEVTVWEIAPSFRDLLKDTRIKFLQDTVAGVHPGPSPSSSTSTSTSTSAGTISSPSDGSSGVGSWSGGSAGVMSGGKITLESGAELEYDWLVLSLGAETQMSFVPGAKGVANAFATLRDAMAVDNKLTALERAQFAGGSRRPIKVLVVGAGYSGVELSCVVAERLGTRGQVQIVDPSPTICSAAPVANREAALKALQDKGVEITLNARVTSMSSTQTDSDTNTDTNSSTPSAALPGSYPISVELSFPAAGGAPQGGSPPAQAEADLVLWTVGTRPLVPAVQGEGAEGAPAAFPVTGRGQAEVEESLRVKGHPNVFALGDAAAFLKPGADRPLAGTAQVAFQQADYVGWNIWASINGRPMLPFRYQHLGEMMTLGSGEGAVSVGFIDNFFLGGRLAHTARKLAYLYRLPTFGHQAKVGVSWLGKAVVDTVAEVQNTLAQVFSQPR